MPCRTITYQRRPRRLPHLGLPRRRGKATLEKVPLPDITLGVYPEDVLKRHVADSTLHMAVLYRHDPGSSSETGLRTPVEWKLVYRAGSPTSEAALHYVESRLQA